MALLSDGGYAAAAHRMRNTKAARRAVVRKLKSQIVIGGLFLVGCTDVTPDYLSADKSSPDHLHVRQLVVADGRSGALLPSNSGDDAVADPYAAMAELREDRVTLQHQLSAQEQQLRDAIRRRQHAQAQIEGLRAMQAHAGEQLASLPGSNALQHERAKMVEARLDDVIRQRDDAVQEEEALRAAVARLESRRSALAEDQLAVRTWLKARLSGSVEALREIFDGTGVDLKILMARAAGADGSGLGGPFEGIDAMREAEVLGQAGGGMAERLRELSALQKVASSLPLALPLDGFEITSRFGRRSDPFMRGLAFHPGLDFGAPRGSQVMATAPGRVIRAGRSGPYGNLVEIDHGMGVITRYGHLKTVLVEAGEEVDVRQSIGVIGSTGRSTGRHLHYEIRVDEIAFEPARFIEAGRYLADVMRQPPTAIASGPG
jgi:murein DD-endopeptidase MepM/ murein hydrolase activator NlpD